MNENENEISWIKFKFERVRKFHDSCERDQISSELKKIWVENCTRVH